MKRVRVKVEEYVQVRRVRTIEVNLEDDVVKKSIDSRETMIFDMDEEGDSKLINIVCDKIDKTDYIELERNKVEDMEVMCIMRMKILKVSDE